VASVPSPMGHAGPGSPTFGGLASGVTPPGPSSQQLLAGGSNAFTKGSALGLPIQNNSGTFPGGTTTGAAAVGGGATTGFYAEGQPGGWRTPPTGNWAQGVPGQIQPNPLAQTNSLLWPSNYGGL
jgi:hypothetical protein